MSQSNYGLVGMDEIGEAAGISGPAIYRYFRGKQHLLAELLFEPFDGLLAGAHDAVALAQSPREALDLLVEAHIFATSQGIEMIDVYNRHVGELLPADRVRLEARLNEYTDIWVRQIRAARPETSPSEAKLAVEATYRLFNMPMTQRREAASRHDDLIQRMARSALFGLLDSPRAPRRKRREARVERQHATTKTRSS